MPISSSWFSLLSLGVFSDQLKLVHDRIYKTLPGAVSCFRLTNATHQIGCSGNVGVGGDVGHTHTHTQDTLIQTSACTCIPNVHSHTQALLAILGGSFTTTPLLKV